MYVRTYVHVSVFGCHCTLHTCDDVSVIAILIGPSYPCTYVFSSFLSLTLQYFRATKRCVCVSTYVHTRKLLFQSGSVSLTTKFTNDG